MARLCGTVVERRSFAGKLSLCCAWLAADGWPLMWVNHRYMSTNQANSAFHPFGVSKWVVSCNWMSATSVGVLPSGECLRNKGRYGSCRWQVKLSDHLAVGPYLSALEMRFVRKCCTNRHSLLVFAKELSDRFQQLCLTGNLQSSNNCLQLFVSECWNGRHWNESSVSQGANSGSTGLCL